MFSTSAGIAVDFHYCQGSLQNISFFKPSKNCHEKTNHSHSEKVKKSCHSSAENNISSDSKDKCCDDQAYFFQLDTDYGLPSFVDFEYNKTLLAFVTEIPVFEINSYTFYNAKDYAHYKPPLSSRDHIILFQTFLI